MARTETLVQLNQTLLDLLDRVAAERGVSRSQVIREAVADYLGAQRRTDVDQRLVEGYQRHPQADDEPGWSDTRRREAWGDLEW